MRKGLCKNQNSNNKKKLGSTWIITKTLEGIFYDDSRRPPPPPPPDCNDAIIGFPFTAFRMPPIIFNFYFIGCALVR